MLIIISPVSYTHLDVYKRQVLILGAGLIGLKCAEGIAGKAKSITVVDMADHIPVSYTHLNLQPQLELEVPVLFSAMSYGSLSYNAHESLARAAAQLGILYNTGEGGLHEDFYRYGKNTIVQVASGRFGVHKDYLLSLIHI